MPDAGPLPLHRALGLERPCVFATVGGGGKTTLLFALAAEAGAAGAEGLSVLTTTAKMTVPAEFQSLPHVLGANAAFRAAALEDVSRRGLAAAVVGSGAGSRGRVLGVDPAWPRSALGLAGVQFVGVEADGSAGRPFKAPAAHEPVIPEGVDAVAAVVGVQVLGRRIGGAAVHRPERVRALAGADDGAIVEPGLIARVLAHADGGRKDVPGGAGYAVVISSAARDMPGARRIAAACRDAGIERVLAFDSRAGIAELL